MYCPECGHDAGDAKFCPECGANLAGVRGALEGRSGGEGARAGRSDDLADGGGGQSDVRESAKRGTGGLSPAIIWGGFGAVAVVVIVVVVMLSGGFGGASGSPTPSGSSAATPVEGVVTGNYSSLVKKANDFYDKGDTAFQNQNFDQGAEYFKAAAMTYAAAWKKKQSDPNVGTDFATALFYAGNLDAAVKQIDAVLKKFPDFQPAYYNLGNYLAHEGRIADSNNKKQDAKKAYAQAKQAYAKAISLNPSSDVGKQADSALKSLPK
jgi:hypothetical protein